MSELIDRLRRLTKETSDARVARDLGITYVYLWRILNGERQVGAAMLARIYKAYPHEFPELGILIDAKKRKLDKPAKRGGRK
jgi:transcriptional regulator with XRE-family HTH domain